MYFFKIFSLVFEAFSRFLDATIVDIINCKNTEKTTIKGSERTITNGTDDDGKSYVQNGNAKITSESDDFGRTTEIKTSIKDEDDFVEKK